MWINTIYSVEWSLISADTSQKFTFTKVEQVPRHSREPTGIAEIFNFKHFN